MGPTNDARRPLTAALTATCCLLFASAAGAQQTWYVDVGGIPPGSGTALDPYTSVQYALDQATTVDGDTLLVLPGTYDEVIDFVGKAVTVQSSDGPLTTILRGNPAAIPPASVVTIVSGEGPGSVLQGFTLRDGNGTLVSGSEMGGGLYVADSDPTLLDCIVRNNQAVLGGGAAFVRTTPTISDCTFSNNVATQVGGGLFLRASYLTSPRMESTSILDNVAGGSGGGIYTTKGLPGPETELFAWNCTISGNSTLTNAYDGGGIYFDAGYHWLIECTIADNYAGQGGGVYCTNGSEVSFTACRIDDNRASFYGGGIFGDASFQVILWGGSLERNLSGLAGAGIASFNTIMDLRGSILHANHTGTSGGAVYHIPGMPGEYLNIDHCTVYGNKADNGYQGIYALGYVDVSNSILWGNGLDLRVDPNYSTLEYSDVGWANISGTANISADPLLWEPEQGDFNLRPGSPCIDTGDPSSPLDPDGSITDMGAVTYSASYCPPTTTYCTAGTTTNGCNATMGATGTASVSAPSGFAVTASGVEGQKLGLLFWGLAPGAKPWGGGTSFRCVSSPLQRTTAQNSGGTSGACDGVLALDFNTWMQTHPGKAPPAGDFVYMQAWFRDPPAPKTTSLSDGLRFAVCP